MGFLRVISDHLDAVFELPDKPRKLGRGSDCDIQIPHKSVSRHHCIITQQGSQLRIEDLGSTFGTHVNGAQISDGQAVEGDKIRVGRVVLVYENELSHSSVRILRNQGDSLPVAQPIAPAAGQPVAAVKQAAPGPASKPVAAPSTPSAPAPAAQSAPPSEPASAPPSAPAPAAPKPQAKPDLPKFAPVAPAKPKAAKPKRPEPIKPVIGKNVGKPAPEPEEEDDENVTEESGPPVGVFANIGGRKKGGKPKRHDYNQEAKGWEKKAAAMSAGEGGPDYAAEADEWEEVWGKQRHHKRFTFPGLGWLGSLFGIFGGLGLKMRMMIVMAVMILGAGGVKMAYDKATAHVLVPKKKIRTRPSTGNEKGDEVLDKAIESFQKAIPKELQGK